MHNTEEDIIKSVLKEYLLGKQLENVQKRIRTESCNVLESWSCKLSCMSSLYATVQTVAQKIKNLIPLRMSVREGAGVL